MSAPFDTLEVAKRLGDGGFTFAQAQTAAAVLSDVLKSDIANRTDVENAVRTAKLELEAKIIGVEGKIAEAKAETIKWLIGIIGFQTLVILGGILGGVAALLKAFGK